MSKNIFEKENRGSSKTVLYFGLFDPEFGRNKVYIEGLRRNGVTVTVCTDSAPGLRKFRNLWRKHRALRGTYDLLIVGYPGYTIAPFARLIATAPVVLDAGWSLYESAILSRDSFRSNPLRVPIVRFADWLAVRAPHFVLVETDRQKDHFVRELGADPRKLRTVYTSVDDSLFHSVAPPAKRPRFTVLFRGRITAEAGAVHALRAAKLLEAEPAGREVDFLIIGFGWDRPMCAFEAAMAELAPKNVEWVREQLAPDDLRRRMLSCHASLGQLEDHDRLSRTVPHKAYESLAMKLPYVTARTGGVREILSDGENCLMVNPADPADIAAKIRMLRDDPALAARLAENGYRLYREKFAPEKAVAPILDILYNR